MKNILSEIKGKILYKRPIQSSVLSVDESCDVGRVPGSSEAVMRYDIKMGVNIVRPDEMPESFAREKATRMIQDLLYGELTSRTARLMYEIKTRAMYIHDREIENLVNELHDVIKECTGGGQ